MKKQSNKIILYFFIPLLFFSKTYEAPTRIRNTNSIPLTEFKESSNVKETIPYELERLIRIQKMRIDQTNRLQNNIQFDLDQIRNKNLK